jgi:DMSO/TMAO reductase YedYZ molybdopterin-dependent catalytic subunit
VAATALARIVDSGIGAYDPLAQPRSYWIVMTDREPSSYPASRHAAAAGLAAGAAALGAAELIAGIVPGAANPVVAVGDAVIALQPAGAKQFVVDLFGEADKLVLNILVIGVAAAASAGLGVLARDRPGMARAGFGVFGLVFLAAGLRDPLAEPLTTLLNAAISVAMAVLVLAWLMRLAGARAAAPVAEMPVWERRRFLGTSLAVIGVAVGGGVVGRRLLERGRIGAVPQAGTIPAPQATAAPLPPGSALEVEGLSPVITPIRDFYRIDTALIVPRPRIATWRLRVGGMVDRPFELSYDELVAMPIEEQYVTIACVSNEVGGNLVGNALWGGVRLKALLERAGVQPGATQIVGRSVDRFTAGFPTEWALQEGREPLVAVSMNGEPLPPNHGFPARLIVPGLYGYVSATKWLAEIELTTLDAFDAYWVPLGWAKEAPILTQSRIDVPRDAARLSAGTIPIAGVAWAPDRGIRAVDVRIDEGEWLPAELSAPISDATWVQFVLRWEATPGEHVVRVRATDGDGVVQTDERTRPAPDGARGHHAIRVTIT